jgi:YD repeat-containing protein
MVSRLVLLFLLAAFFNAAPVLAQDPVYDQSGGQYGRGYFAPLPFERIDTVTGNVFLSFTDISLPGDGQIGLSIVRTYNSRDGRWRMGIGGVPLHLVFNLPNGSLDDVDFITPDGATHNAVGPGPTTLTQGFWRFTKATRVLELPNGVALTYAHSVPNVGWNLTEIRDPFDNLITLTWTAGTDQLTRIAQGVGGHVRYIEVAGWTDDRASSLQLDTTVWNYTWSTALPGHPQLTTMAPPGGARWTFTYGVDPLGATKLLSLKTVNGGTVTYTWAVQNFPTTPSQRVAIATRETGGRAPVAMWSFNWQDTGRLLEIHGPTHIVMYWTQVVDDIPVRTQKFIKTLGDTVVETETISYISVSHPVSGTMPVVSQITVVREGQTFTTSFSYGANDWANYGQPTQIVETGDLTRTTTLTYEHGFSKYIRGKVTSRAVTVNGQTVTQTMAYNMTNGFLTASADSDVVTAYSFDGRGNTDQVTDAAGRATTFTYDWGVVNQIASPDNAVVVNRTIGLYGQVLSETTQGSSATTLYTYDAAGRVTEVSTTPTGRQAVTTTYHNDVATFEWVSTTVTRGSVWVRTDLDGWGRAVFTEDSTGVKSRTTYDGAGRVIKQSRPFGGTVDEVWDTFQYDLFNRRTKVIRPDGSTVETYYDGDQVTVVESLGGGQTRTSKQNYQTFASASDARLVSVVDALNHTWTYTYNHRGQLTGVTDPGASTPSRTWIYNAQGRVLSMTQPESGTSIVQYDNLVANNVGNVTYTEDQRGPALSGTTYTYDTNHRLVSVNAPGMEEDTTMTYDVVGRTATVGNGVVQTTITYDAFSRVASRTDVIAGRAFTQTFTYDAFDNVVEQAYPRTGRKVIYEYDAQQRLTAVKTQVGTGAIATIADTFAYRGDGSLASHRFGNNQTASVTQDNRQRPLTWKSGPLDITYAYDPVGNVTSITDVRGSAFNQTFTYDLLDRIATSTKNGATTTFTHSPTGDRLTQADPAGAITFTYNANRQLASVSGPLGGTFSYDVVGSLTGDPSGATYAYNASNKLKATTASGQTTTYQYGAGGMRAVKTGPDGIPHLFVYGGGGGPIAEYKLEGGEVVPVRETVYLGAQPLVSYSPANVTPPPMTVALASPGDNTTIASGQQITLTATVTLGAGISLSRVEYYVRGVLIGDSTSGPLYAKTWTNTPLPPGSFVFHARAVATDGRAVASTPVTVIVQ